MTALLYSIKFVLTLVGWPNFCFYISKQAKANWAMVKRQHQSRRPVDPGIQKKAKKRDSQLLRRDCLPGKPGGKNARKTKYSAEEIGFLERIGDHTRVSIKNSILFKDVYEKMNIKAQLIQSIC